MNMHPRSNAVFNEKTNEAAFLQEFIIYNVYLGIPPYRTTKQINKKVSRHGHRGLEMLDLETALPSHSTVKNIGQQSMAKLSNDIQTMKKVPYVYHEQIVFTWYFRVTSCKSVPSKFTHQ